MSTISYVYEKWTPVGTYSVEDYESPGGHFFPEDYAAGKRMRFNLWRDGCGWGQARTLEQAKRKVLRRAADELKVAMTRLLQQHKAVFAAHGEVKAELKAMDLPGAVPPKGEQP